MTTENCLRSKSCYTSAPKAEKACSPGKRARSLGWIRTLACGAGDLWFRRRKPEIEGSNPSGPAKNLFRRSLRLGLNSRIVEKCKWEVTIFTNIFERCI